MGKALALLASLAGLIALGFYLTRELARGERDLGPPSSSARRGSRQAESQLPTAASASVTRESASVEPRADRLRGRVLDAEGAPLAAWDACLSYVEEALGCTETDADGRFEFAGPLRAGTLLSLSGPEGWIVEPAQIELDALPDEELVFVARLDAREELLGPVRGVIVDEVDGTPLPYLDVGVAREKLETDAEGRFETAERHPRGVLQIGSRGWDLEIAFDPSSREPLLVPARVGPTIYLDIRGEAGELHASWSALPSPAKPRAFVLQFAQACTLRRESPALVRLPGRERRVQSTGEIQLHSVPEGLIGRGLLVPGVGTRLTPLSIELQRCAYLGVELRLLGRYLEWYEALEVALISGELECAVHEFSWFGTLTFAVLEEGDYLLEARLDGQVLAQEAVRIDAKDARQVTLDVNVPPHGAGPEEPEVELLPVSGRVLSARNRPTRGQIRLTRASDGEESLLELRWAKSDGRWVATFAGEAPPGELRADLEMEPCFGYSGPRTLTLPSAEELVYALDDAVPLVDVYLSPVAAEDGAALLSYYAALFLDDGDCFGFEDFGSPSLPIAVGHPSNVPFTWLCISGGRVAASGRYEGSLETRPADGDVRIPISLAGGWGAFLYVGDPKGEPLAGAEVFLDGVRHGLTGADGHLALAGARPSSITVRYRDWRIEDGEVEASGAFDDSSVDLRAYLAPPAR